jgi:hypothetical protein
MNAQKQKFHAAGLKAFKVTSTRDFPGVAVWYFRSRAEAEAFAIGNPSVDLTAGYLRGRTDYIDYVAVQVLTREAMAARRADERAAAEREKARAARPRRTDLPSEINPTELGLNY